VAGTDLVFRTEPYARTCSARVISAEPGAIRLSRTVFYPAGGGQLVEHLGNTDHASEQGYAFFF
jgi:Ser-tRNA(Ala) deacylase AlaX